VTARVEDRIRQAAAPLLQGLTKPQTGAVICLLLGMVMIGTPHLATIATYLAQQEVHGPFGREIDPEAHRKRLNRLINHESDRVDEVVRQNAVRSYVQRWCRGGDLGPLLLYVDSTNAIHPWSRKMDGVTWVHDGSAPQRGLDAAVELGLNALTVTARVEPERNRRGRRRRVRSPDRAAAGRGQRLPLAWETYRAEGGKGSAEKETYEAVMKPLLEAVGPGVPLAVAHDRGYSGIEWFATMDRVFEAAPDATWCVLEGNRKGGRLIGLRGRDDTQLILKIEDALEQVKCDKVFWHHDPANPDDDARVRVGFRSAWLLETTLPADEDGRRRGAYQETERTLAVLKCPKYFGTKAFAFLLGKRVRGAAWAKRVFLSFYDRNLREDTHRAAGEFFDVEEIRVWKRFKAYSRLARLAMLAQRIVCELNLHPTRFRTRCLKAGAVMGAPPSRDYTYRLVRGMQWLLMHARLRGPWRAMELSEEVALE
jgi:hypothetical protein